MKRYKSKGIFYLLKDGSHYKFGATTRTVQTRLTAANRKKQLTYKIIYQQPSKDVFGFENTFRWKIYDEFGIPPEEFFVASSDVTAEALIELAEQINV